MNHQGLAISRIAAELAAGSLVELVVFAADNVKLWRCRRTMLGANGCWLADGLSPQYQEITIVVVDID